MEALDIAIDRVVTTEIIGIGRGHILVTDHWTDRLEADRREVMAEDLDKDTITETEGMEMGEGTEGMEGGEVTEEVVVGDMAMKNQRGFIAVNGVSIAEKWDIGPETVRIWMEEEGAFIAERMAIWHGHALRNKEECPDIEGEAIQECQNEPVSDKDDHRRVGHAVDQVQGKGFRNKEIVEYAAICNSILNE